MCSDIALVAVRPEPHDVPALPLADVTGLGPGARVRVLGYHATPGGEGTPAPLATQGTVSSVGVSERLFPRLHVVPGLILHQSPMPEGATGGALVDGRGRLVGVNVDIHPGGEGADRPHLAKAVAASYLKSTIAELEPGRAGLYRNWEKYHACHGEMMMLAQQTRAGKTTSAAHGMPSGHAHKTRDHGGMSGH
jgi:S1-C subfamily serine protease